ncbi:protein NipSnap isoform X2 [Hyalella azteca]|uniref:Protein NipSnap isoform X2 n=1 Tax=Hyalella azteca TaxID=294128 RepID=A0A8B7NQW1_HYAAZ|nr:protein NipSnap isoform X2 [Hyalella azteca]
MALRIASLLQRQQVACTEILKRGVSSTSSCSQDGGWFNKLLVRKIEPTKESHSRMLSDKEVIYELQTHNLKPGTVAQYLKNYDQYVQEVKERNLHLELCGSWTVGVGDQDQCVHLWKYDGGYKSIDQAKRLMDEDTVIQNLLSDRNVHLRSRSNQYLLSFSFWPLVTPRQGGNIYEIRSYFLKPGTMIEWGNNWARAITFRQSNNEAFGGFFSQVGRLYNVHHIWCYGSLQLRKEQRENAWRKPGWDEVVAYTVPLIEEYHSKILYPNFFSPTH